MMIIIITMIIIMMMITIIIIIIIIIIIFKLHMAFIFFVGFVWLICLLSNLHLMNECALMLHALKRTDRIKY